MITQYELPLLGCKVILANSYDSELSISYLRHRLTSKNTNQKTFLMFSPNVKCIWELRNHLSVFSVDEML